MMMSGMIQDRIEKLGRDVFYDMLSTDREPLHALCVLKVSIVKLLVQVKVQGLEAPLGTSLGQIKNSKLGFYWTQLVFCDPSKISILGLGI